MAITKAREIQAKLQGNTDPKIVNILCALAERDEVQHAQIMQLAEAYDRLVNMFTIVAQGAMKNKDNVDSLLMRMGIDNKTGVKVESIAESDDDQGKTH